MSNTIAPAAPGPNNAQPEIARLEDEKAQVNSIEDIETDAKAGETTAVTLTAEDVSRHYALVAHGRAFLTDRTSASAARPTNTC